MNALTGKRQGSGLHVEPRLPTNTRNISVPKTRGAGTSGLRGAGGRSNKKNKNKKLAKGSGLFLGKNSPFNNVPILGAIF